MLNTTALLNASGIVSVAEAIVDAPRIIDVLDWSVALSQPLTIVNTFGRCQSGS